MSCVALIALVNIPASNLFRLLSRNVFRRAVCQCHIVVNGKYSTELIKEVEVHCKDGHFHKAVELIDAKAPHVIPDVYRLLLQTCTNCKDLEMGHKVHSIMRRTGHVSDPLLNSHLVRMFDACGSLVEAKEAFFEISRPNVYAWSAIISACAKHGHAGQALDFYRMMQEAGVEIDAHTFVVGLKSCAMQGAWILGMLVHEQILELGFDSSLYLQNALIDMYGKSGNLNEALKVFNSQTERDTVTWNVMLACYTLNSKLCEAFEIFIEMYQAGKADSVTYVNLLKLCSNTGAMIEGYLTLFVLIENGLEQEIFVVSSSIDFYAKCGCIEDAQCLFKKSINHDVVTWNALIVGLSHYDGVEHGYRTLEFFRHMIHHSCMLPDSTTYACVLRACSSMTYLAQIKFFFAFIIKKGFPMDKLVLNALITAYARCGCPLDAYKIFQKMFRRDQVTWNAMISGYAQNGLLNDAFQLMRELQQEGGMPDMGSWNSLMAGYLQHGYGWKALSFFQQMQQEGFVPDRYTFISVFNACASVGAGQLCRLYHLHMLECNLFSDTYVINALIDMYGKCGSLEMAHSVFKVSSKCQVSTWNSLVAGYAQHGHHEEAYDLVLQMKKQVCRPDIITWNAMFSGLVSNENAPEAFWLFNEMVSGDVQPDNATFVSLMKGCSLTGAFNLGQLFYAHAVSNNLESNTALCNACIDMYALCGSLRDAILLFERLQMRDRITWNTLIAGFAVHNFVGLSFRYFENMRREGVKPDIVTFTSLLSACGHSGALDKDYLLATSTSNIWKALANTIEQVNCVVDLLGRAGHLSEAESLLVSLLPQTTVVGWTALLNNCRTYGNLDIGNRCFEHMISSGNECQESGLLFVSNAFWNTKFMDDFQMMSSQFEMNASYYDEHTRNQNSLAKSINVMNT